MLLIVLTLACLSLYAGKPARDRELPDEPVSPAVVIPVAELRTNLLADLIETMDAAVQDRDPVIDRKLLLSPDDVTGTYVYNTNHPAFPFHGVTGISVRGNGSNCGHNGTLVAPRIVVTAGHCWQQMHSTYYYTDGQGRGAHWRFLDRNGKVHYAYAQSSRLLTNTVTGKPIDTRMFVLSNAMPASVEPALWASPKMVERAGGLAELPRFVGSGNKELWPHCHFSITTNYTAWRRGIRGGDSGSGSFVPFGTNLVLVSTFGGNITAEGVNWRETAEWLSTKFGHKASIPTEVDLRVYK